MGHLRVRHNAKARQSSKSTGSDSKKKRRRSSGPSLTTAGGQDEHDTGDANAEVLVPQSKADKAAQRAARLRAELLAQQDNSKMSSKKRRRMDNWINKKLAKEERVKILAKLERQQQELGERGVEGLVSSSRLGSGRMTTWREEGERGEDREVRKALGKRGKKYVEEGEEEADEDEDADLDEQSGSEGTQDEMDLDRAEGKGPPEPTSQHAGTSTAAFSVSASVPAASAPVPKAAPVLGGALAKRADGTVVAPIVVTRGKKHKKAKREPTPVQEEEESEFDSSDSAWDESSDGGEQDSEGEAEQEEREKEQDELMEEDLRSSPAPGESVLGKRKRGLGGFKQWANKQLDLAKGFEAVASATTSTTTPPTDIAPPKSIGPAFVPPNRVTAEPAPSVPHLLAVPQIADPRPKPLLPSGPLGAHVSAPSSPFALTLRNLSPNPLNRIPLHRPPDVQQSRLLLPIVAEEQNLMETILLNPVTVVCGETGSGKTTQLPSLLYERGFSTPGSDNPGMICVTQPRRVAAMSTAARVSYELGLPSPVVAHAVRYDQTTSPETRVKFVTDGVLLRELGEDFLLEKYSVVVLDEAHERTLGTDVLVGVLSRVVRLREKRFIEGCGKPLRLVIMSATLRLSDFLENTSLFPTPPPMVHIPARQHPVTIHFSRRTEPDYVSEVVKKVERIHTRLPGGGVLVFLTGQREIELVVRRLEGKWGRKALERRRAPGRMKGRQQDGAVPEEKGAGEPVAVSARVGDVEPEEVDLGERGDELAPTEEEEQIAKDDKEGDDEYDVEDEEEDEQKQNEADAFDVPMHVLPLYSLLPSNKQMKVFQPPPADARLVVIATNVAETSLTIPGIRYVVDSGRAKERHYDLASGIQSYQISWESKASAAQRAGRAGRTGPGHCYRLYSSAVFENHFPAFAEPEILRMPIEAVVLQMKSINIDQVVNFPFPTPPDRVALKKAEGLLVHLGALEPSNPASKQGTLSGRITELGKAMALFPVAPRFAKMLVAGKQHGCLPYVVAIVAALSVGDPFLREDAIGQKGEDDDLEDDDDQETAHIKNEDLRAKEERKRRRKAFFESQQVYSALGNGTSDIFRILAVVGAFEYEGGTASFCAAHFVRFKAMEEIRKLRSQLTAIVRANFGEILPSFLARLDPPSEVQLKALRQLLTAGFVDHVAVRKDIASPSSATGAKHASARGVPYRAMGIEEDVYIHPSSVLCNAPPPEFVIYLELVRTSRVYLKTLTTINSSWLSTLGKSLCTFSKPMELPAGVKAKMQQKLGKVDGKAKAKKGEEREVHVVPRFGPQAWELPPVRMTQRREGTRWVYVQ